MRGIDARRDRAGRPLAIACCLIAGLLQAAAPRAWGSEANSWVLPPAGSCEPSEGLKGWPLGEDAPPFPFKPGDSFEVDALPLLRNYIPPELWQQRERFFYEGMRLEIGPCFADYSPPEFFRAATRKFRGTSKLDPAGGLTGYVAGRPFPADGIDPADPKAGVRWAWNVATRYQAGGMRGEFRVSDIIGETGRAEPFEGEIFKLQLLNRADQAKRRYKAKGAKDKVWVAGGKMSEPFNARGHAWRQYRDRENLTEAMRSDDMHAYLPAVRRVRRLNAARMEGLYMPSFAVGVQQSTVLPIAGGGEVGAAAMSTLTTKRSGFEGLELRPVLSEWKLLGVQDVLAPVNAIRPLYPVERDREFGPWGLSFASDRWDLRRALILEGHRKESLGADDPARAIYYVDLETLTPLYYMSYDARGEPIDVGQYVGRWSETRDDYPRWPDDDERAIRVIDTVGASFANLSEFGGWRRESWQMISTPPDDKVLRRMISVSGLTKGR